MPLNYAAVIGGTCTLVGTSTNILVSSLAASADGARLVATAVQTNASLWRVRVDTRPVDLTSAMRLDIDTPRFMINSDATIVAPLIFAYVLGW